jgi:hypothetical protein
VADRGYDQPSVQDAFDAFYRHLAQLDSTLRSLEAVDAFRGQAAELRADLRSIRAAGWSPYPRGYPVPPAPSFGLPEAVPRIALEVIFLVAVAAVLAVANFGAPVIVAVMALAFAITATAEYVAGRDRAPIARPAAAAAPPQLDEPLVDATGFPPAAEVAEPEGWAAFAEPSGPEALTVMEAISLEAEAQPADSDLDLADEPDTALEAGESEEATAAESTAELSLREPVAHDAEGELGADLEAAGAKTAPEAVPEEEPVPVEEETLEGPRRRWAWRRRQARAEAVKAPGKAGNADRSKHVRVLPQPEPVLERDLDPWERGFDFDADDAALKSDQDEALRRPPR